jgi:hypothetical protein
MEVAMDGRRRRHAAARSRVAAGALSVAVFLGLGTNMAATAAGGGTTSDTAGDTAGTTEQQGSWSATPAAPSTGQQAVTGSQGS